MTLELTVAKLFIIFWYYINYGVICYIIGFMSCNYNIMSCIYDPQYDYISFQSYLLDF